MIVAQIDLDQRRKEACRLIPFAGGQSNAFDMIADAIENLEGFDVAQFNHFGEIIERIAFQIEKL